MRKTCSILIFLILLSLGGSYLQASNSHLKGNTHFVLQSLPEGFTFVRTPEYYGTYEKELANGTIFTYMNGGGEVYISHGFKELTHILLKDKLDNTITLNIFNMGTVKNAEAAFADESICPPGFKKITIGVTAKTYRYTPDFFLYFIKGKHLLYIAVNNDTLSKTLLDYAKDIYNKNEMDGPERVKEAK